MKWSILVILVFSSGCSVFTKKDPVRHIAESPKVEVKGGDVSIKGDAEAPAKVDTKKSDAVMPIPEGSTFVFNEKLGTMTLTISKATQLALNRTETAIEGPKAFTPDKGPTVGEEKAAQADFWATLALRAGVAIGLAAGLFGLVRGWDMVMYGGGAVSLACLFGLFVQKHPLILVFIGLGTAAAVVGPYLYHSKIKHLNGDTSAK